MFSRYGWLYSTQTHLTTLKLTGIILFTSAISYHANKIRGNSRLKQTVLLDGPLTNTRISRSPYRAQLQFTRISRRRLYIWIAIWSCDISRKSIHIKYVSWAYHTKIACLSTYVIVACRLDEILIHTSVRHRYTYLCFNTSIFQTAGGHGFVVRTGIQYSDSACGLPLTVMSAEMSVTCRLGWPKLITPITSKAIYMYFMLSTGWIYFLH